MGVVTEGDLELTKEAIVQLPIDALALAVLKNYSESSGWSRHNWVNSATGVLGRGAHLDALAEAWAWLEAKALVAKSPSQSSESARFITRMGLRAVELNSLAEIQASDRIALDLHPRLDGKVRPVFLLGDYEIAAFKAMKEVEVRVREIGAFPADLVGVKLMRKAFEPGKGPLSIQNLEAGEQQARSDLFAGVIGSFKNPTSHRAVVYEDPTEASEVVLVADLLMRVLDSVEASIENQRGNSI